MRKPFLILTAVFAATPALADQTDPRLDLLFEELRTGEALRAEENVLRIVEIWQDSSSDTVDLLYARAQESAALGRSDLALELLEHVIGLAPHFAQGYALRGAVRLSEGDQGGAIADFTKTLELEPRQFEARAALANIMLASGQKREAYEMFQQALEWNPHDEQLRQRARALRRDIDGQDI